MLPSDMPTAKIERVAVLFDYENTRRNALDAFGSASCPPYLGVFDPIGLAEDLCRMRKRQSELSKVLVYRGRPVPDHQPTPARHFDRLNSSWSKSHLFEMKKRDLKYRFFEDGSFSAQEKGIDVWLATDLISCSIKRTYDALIVVSTDTDLLPAIEFVLHQTNQHIEVACWQAKHIHPLQERTHSGPRRPYCHFLPRDAFNLHCQDDEKFK